MTTCGGCGTSYGGHRTEHCTAPGCHQTFTGTTAGDKHRTGEHGVDRRCLTPEEMAEKGMRRNERGHWTTGEPDPRWSAA